jgi:hypothetical protein
MSNAPIQTDRTALSAKHPRRLSRALAVSATATLLSALGASAAHAAATTPPLGTAANYAAVAATTITNTGPSDVTGDLGVSPGSAIVGFPPGNLTGAKHAADGPAAQAAADVLTAYNAAAGQPCDFTRSNADLGGATLPPGVYCFTSTSVAITGTLTLDAGGDINAAWIFKTGSTLVTASNSAVVLINGASPCSNNNITWQVGSSATLGSATSFVGNILASASVTLNTGAVTTGGLYGHTGAVTMDTNNVSTCAGSGGKSGPAITTTPSPSVNVGGSISDTARIIGGTAPTGSVAFTLYGPGDTTCQTPLTTSNGTLAAGSATSASYVATTPGTYRWVAVYGGDGANNAVTSPCGMELVDVTSTVLTGRAYGLAVTSSLVGLPLALVAPTPDTGFVSTTSSSSTTTPCRATLSGLVGAHVLCANVTTDAPAGRSTASASVADAGIGLTLIPTITLAAVQSSSTTTCAGSSGSTTIAYLKVGSTVVISQPTNIAPNTGISVGIVSLVLNEQIPFSTPDDGLTVNAVHASVNVVGLVTANIVVASSESDISGCL